MRVVVLDSENTVEIINHFVAYDFSSFIVFNSKKSKVDVDYYRLNGIEITVINSFSQERTKDKLSKIRGSLKGRFFMVYSSRIADFALDDIVLKHLLSQKTVTLIESDKKLCSALAEEELFDYISVSEDFEREALTRIGEDNELKIYK